MKTRLIIVCILILCFSSIALLAQQTTPSQSSSQTPGITKPTNSNESTSAPERSKKMEGVGEVLLLLLVLSVVFEVALTPIFNWRIFSAYFEGKGYKTPITVILAFIVFWTYKLDIVKELLDSMGHGTQRSFGGQVLTALLIAGGSDGVFRIFTRLKIRNPEERKQKAEEEKKRREEKQKHLQHSH